MQEFDYQLRPRIIFGSKFITKLGPLTKEMGFSRALVVSDPGVVKAGLFSSGEASLIEAGIQVMGFHDLSENPTNLNIERGLQVANQFQPDLLIGLGGGSSMDCAKGINFVYSCGGRIHDYWGVGKATRDMLPMIAIPTTAGTGSETQSFALISDAETHVKMACGDPRAACRIAILDPTLTLSQPTSVTALTGIDAITHALETFVCTKRNPISECYSREAWQLLSQGFPQILETPNDIEGRARMQLGACFAGMAIEASMLGAAHALANPLTATLGVAHGQAVGLMMPHVIRFNSPVVEESYIELAKLLPNGIGAGIGSTASEIIAMVFTRWMNQASLATSLKCLPEWPEELIEDRKQTLAFLRELAGFASKQWTASFNPRRVTESDFLMIYQAALDV
ncbi:MAG TPA: iron-containing alcohol dehydrogenase [Pirellula sp.]|nr:iron-containing alcohol dehydrogenase [Pirellula sp.]